MSEEKRHVPKGLQNEFFEVVEIEVEKFLKHPELFCRFGLKNFAIQMMAHGYYHEQIKQEKHDKQR